MALLRWIACVGICLAVGAIGSIFTSAEIPTWYAALNKPAWTPPSYVFPIVWTVLYILMGTAAWLLWQAPASAHPRAALGWFAIQLVLNGIWTPIFFGAHAIVAGLIIIVLLLIAIGFTMWTAAPIDRRATWLLAPYLVWVVYATTLNAGIVAMN